MDYKIKEWKAKVDSALFHFRANRESLLRHEKQLEALSIEILDYDEADKTAQLVGQALQQKVHKRVSGVVTKCLQSVFPDPYAFDIVFERKRGKTEARLLFLRNGKYVDPTTGAGGGSVDVASFALRCASILLSRPASRRIVVLDEPFKFVSERHREAVKTMLTDLSKELNIQIIQVSHIPELMIGNKIQIR